MKSNNKKANTKFVSPIKYYHIYNNIIPIIDLYKDIRVVTLGLKGAGKTSLLEKLISELIKDKYKQNDNFNDYLEIVNNTNYERRLLNSSFLWTLSEEERDFQKKTLSYMVYKTIRHDDKYITLFEVKGDDEELKYKLLKI